MAFHGCECTNLQCDKGLIEEAIVLDRNHIVEACNVENIAERSVMLTGTAKALSFANSRYSVFGFENLYRIKSVPTADLIGVGTWLCCGIPKKTFARLQQLHLYNGVECAAFIIRDNGLTYLPC